MTIYVVEVRGISQWDDYDFTYAYHFMTRELAEAYIRHMEDKYSDYIDEVIEYEAIMDNRMRQNQMQFDVEFDRMRELYELLTREFGHIRPRYGISQVYVYDKVPED